MSSAPFSRRTPVFLFVIFVLMLVGVRTFRLARDRGLEDVQKTAAESLQPPLLLDTPDAQRWPAGPHPRFLVRLREGQFARLTVEQRGIDLVVEVEPEQGSSFEVDSPMGGWGTEEVFLLGTEEATEYSLILHPLAPSKFSDPSYQIIIRELRRATLVDRQRYEAEKLFHRARVVQERRLQELPKGAEADFLRSAELFEGLGEERRHSDALFLYGLLLENALQYKAAAKSYLDSIQVYEIPDAQVQLANVFMTLGNWDESLERYHRAIELYGDCGRSVEATAWMALGTLERRRGNFEAASEYLQKAYAIFLETGPLSHRLSTLNSLGALQLGQGAPERALPFLQQALREVPDEDIRTKGETLTLLADFYLDQGNLEQAQEHYQAALVLGFSPHSRRRGVPLVGLGRVAEKSNNSVKALEFYGQALEIFEELSIPLDVAITRNNMAWLHLEQGKQVDAQILFQKILKDIEVLGDSTLRGTVHFGLARVARAAGDLEKAEEQIQSAIEALELLRTQSSFENRTAVFASKHDVFSFYIDLLMEQHRANPTVGFDEMALAVAEQSKARGLLDVLAQQGNQMLPAEEKDRWGKTRDLERVSFTQERDLRHLRNRKASQEVIAPVQAGLNRSVAAVSAMQEELGRRYPKIAAIQFPRSMALQAIRDNLTDQETAVLTYYMGHRSSYLWVVRHDHVHSFELGDPKSIDEMVQGLTELMERRRVPGARKRIDSSLNRLAATILPPREILADVRRLVIVPSGELFRVPFAALAWPADESTVVSNVLSGSFEMVHLPSSSVLAASRAKAKTTPRRRLAVLADPLFTEEDERIAGRLVEERPSSRLELSRLLASAEEARIVSSALEDPSNFIALGANASRDLITTGGLADFRYLHFATHGIAHEESPELSYLVLSQLTSDGRWQDGRLTARQVASLEFPAELVVLSACRTGPGRPIRGEGLTGLARSFLLSGARRVLVTLWTVDDQATAEMMRRFYTIHSNGTPPAAALRQAQQEMHRESDWQDPYYWAGFVLFGDWN